MQAKLFRREVLPFLAIFFGLAAAALATDALLHAFGAVWIGRYLGIPGTLLILGSFAYSLRKRKILRSGSPVRLLRLHERMAWLGSMLVLVHAGVHFNALLGWLAIAAMLVNVGSGLTGKFLIDRSQRRLAAARERLAAAGLTPAELDERCYWDSVTLDAVKRWRVIHFPVALAFGVLATTHIVAIFLFWSWR